MANYKYIEVAQPDRGLMKNLPASEISPRHCSDCQNVYFENGEIKKRFGWGSAKTVKTRDGVTITPSKEICEIVVHERNQAEDTVYNGRVAYAAGLTGLFTYDLKNEVWHEDCYRRFTCEDGDTSWSAKDGPPALTHSVGTGLDDVVIGYENTVTPACTLKIKITATGTPDTIRWTDDNWVTDNGSDINITGADQELSLAAPLGGAGSVWVRFDATTGHAANDEWSVAIPVTGQNAVSADTTNKKQGTASLKIAVGANHTTGVIAVYDATRNRNIRFMRYVSMWIQTDVALDAGDLQLVFWDGTEDGGGANYRGCYDKTNGTISETDIPATPADAAFHYHLIDLGAQLGSDFADNDTWGFQLTADKGACNINIDAIVFHDFGLDVDDTKSDAVRMRPFVAAGPLTYLGIVAGSKIPMFYKSTPTDGAIDLWLHASDYNTTYDYHHAADLAKFKQHNLLFSITEEQSGTTYYYLQKVRWSDLLDAAIWDTGTSGNVYLIDSHGNITTAEQLYDNLYVFLDDAVVRTIHLGGETAIFSWDYIYSGDGLIAPKLAIPAGGEIYWAGGSNIYKGIDQDNEIGDRIKDDFYGTSGLNYSSGQYFKRSFILHIKKIHTIFFMVPTSAAYPDGGWGYDYIKDTWTYWDFGSANITAGCSYEMLDEPSTDYPFSGTTWTRKYQKGVILGNSSGQLFEMDFTSSNDNATAIDANWQSKDFSAPNSGNPPELTAWRGIYVKGRGNGVTVSYSIDDGATWTSIGTITFSSTTNNAIYFEDFYTESRYLRIKFSNNTASETFVINKFWLIYDAGAET